MEIDAKTLKILKGLEQVFTKENEKTPLAKDYVNPTAAALLTLAGETVLKADGSPLGADGSNLLEQFNRNNNLTGAKAVEVLDLIFDKSGFMKNFTTLYGDELTIPIDIHASLPEQLISSARAGTQTSAASTDLLAVLGTELFLRNVELQKDIKMTLIRNNLYNPNFTSEIDEKLSTEVRNDLLRLATNGYADTYDAIGEDFYTLAIGHEKELITANGSWTNSNGSTILIGRFGNKVTPNKVDTLVASTLSTATETPTASEVISILDALILAQPDEYKNDPENVFVLSQSDADLYSNGRIGNKDTNNVIQENWRTNGIIPNYKGRRIFVNPFKKALGTAVSGSEVKPNIYLGKLSEFYVGAQKMVESTKEYNPRSTHGGSAIEITKHFWVDFKVRNKESIAIAFAGATVETPVLMNSNSVKSTEITTLGAETSAPTFYPYCDTKGCEIYVAMSDADDADTLLADYATCIAALGTGDESTALLTPGEAYTPAETVEGTQTYFSIRAFKDGVLTRSAAIEFNLHTD